MRRVQMALLLTEEQIRSRVSELAGEIRREYEGRDVLLIGVLKGAFMFLADLVRALALPVDIEFVTLSSYGASTHSSGVPKIIWSSIVNVRDRDVLIIEDIVDTGLSVTALVAELRTEQPRSIRLCVLIDKRERREETVHIDYTGFEIEQGFIVGYGTDCAEKYRHLPAIYRLDLDASG